MAPFELSTSLPSCRKGRCLASKIGMETISSIGPIYARPALHPITNLEILEFRGLLCCCEAQRTFLRQWGLKSSWPESMDEGRHIEGQQANLMEDSGEARAEGRGRRPLLEEEKEERRPRLIQRRIRLDQRREEERRRLIAQRVALARGKQLL